MINDDLLIDLPCDSYCHFLQYGIDARNIKSLLITHVHSDHFYAEELFYFRKGYSAPNKDYQLSVYGSSDVAEKIEKHVQKSNGFLHFEELKPFTPTQIGDYTVTALKALHGTPNPYIYVISQGENTMLYAHDTDLFHEETAQYLKASGIRFDLVSLDCTMGNQERSEWQGHMYLKTNIICKNFLLENGLADENTTFVLNHFSHNGPESNYEDMLRLASPHSFEISYDGMEVEI